MNGPFMMPNMGYSPMMTMAPNMMRSSLGGGLRSLLGLTPRMGSAIGTAGRGINWASLLNNTSKTIGVVKEAIPIVKEVGPMMNNMRSMFKIASASWANVASSFVETPFVSNADASFFLPLLTDVKT